MSSSNKRFETFLGRILPTDPQLDLAKEELDFLENQLAANIQDDDAFIFVKALRAGSYAKHTMLRRHATGDFDVDLAVYVQAEAGGDTPTDDLLDYTDTLLRRTYKKRTHRAPTFDRSSKNSVKVKFEVTPKITLDVAPIVSLEHDTIPNWGIIPRRDGEKRHTSVTEHILFVTDRNKLATKCPFNQTLRLWKWWRDHRFSGAEKNNVSSFLLELVLGKAFDDVHGSLAGEWIEDLRRLAISIVRHGLREPIWFPDPRVPAAAIALDDPVVVLDPMNRSNNVSHDWTESDRQTFLQAVAEFRDLIAEAHHALEDQDEDEALTLLETLFPAFRDWSEE